MAKAIDVTVETFQQEVLERSRSVPVVVDFWAAWCAPCRTLGPVLDDAIERLAGRVVLAKVDVDAWPELAEAFQVQGIPAVKAFRDGVIVSEFSGAQPAPVVDAWLAGLLPSAVEEQFEAARRAAAEGRPADAAPILRRLLADDPNHHAARLELARIVAAQGDTGEALALLDGIPEAAPEAEDAVRERQLLDLLAAGRRVRGLDAAKAAVAEAPRDLEARFALAGAAWLANDAEGAIDALLEIVRRDRAFRGDGARRALLALFERLGHDHPVVGPAQSRLGMILFS